jgi:CheY-like chemotaxis protein
MNDCTKEPLRILVVEDILDLRTMFVTSLQRTFPDVEVTGTENLTNARKALAHTSYDAIITDCGFPLDTEQVRQSRNRNGIILISEIRNGQYGPQNAAIPIAFNSAELTQEKRIAALRCGGNTKCFTKGSYYGVLTKGRIDTNFTERTVAGATTDWLKSELTEEKISERRSALNTNFDTAPHRAKGFSLKLPFKRDISTQRG